MIQSLRAPWLVIALLVGTLGVGMSLASVASAQEEPAVAVEAIEATDAGGDAAVVAEVAEEPAAEEAGIGLQADFEYTINTLIMFICAVLVLFMQAGFAMVEVGLNSSKNTVNILAKNVLDLSVGVILYLVVGYG